MFQISAASALSIISDVSDVSVSASFTAFSVFAAAAAAFAFSVASVLSATFDVSAVFASSSISDVSAAAASAFAASDVSDTVRGEYPYHDTELLYRRRPSVRPRSSIRPRPRSRQPRFGSSLDNAFWHFRTRGRPRSQHGMPTCAPVLPAVYRAQLSPVLSILFIIHSSSIHYYMQSIIEIIVFIP